MNKALVLGVGLQGKAVIHDLDRSPLIGEIVAADHDLESAGEFVRKNGLTGKSGNVSRQCDSSSFSKSK